MFTLRADDERAQGQSQIPLHSLVTEITPNEDLEKYSHLTFASSCKVFWQRGYIILAIVSTFIHPQAMS